MVEEVEACQKGADDSVIHRKILAVASGKEPVLKDLDYQLHEGEYVVWASGIEKSTLMN